MSNKIKKQFAESIMGTLKMKIDPFSLGAVQAYTKCIRPEHLEDYYKSLFDDDSEYMLPMDRISAATKKYRSQHTREQYANAKELAMKIGGYLKAVNINESEKLKGLDLEERLKRVLPDVSFTALELNVIHFAGGLDVFIPHYEALSENLSSSMMVIDNTSKYLEQFYIDIFFGEEPKPKPRLKS